MTRNNPMKTPGPSSLQVADSDLQNGDRLTKKQLARAIEQSPGEPLPNRFRQYLVKVLRTGMPRGRKPKSEAVRDFELEGIPALPGRKEEIGPAELYEQKLNEFQKDDRAERARSARTRRTSVPETRDAPSIRAANYVLQQFRSRFPGMNASRFLNLLSERGYTKRGRADDLADTNIDWDVIA